MNESMEKIANDLGVKYNKGKCGVRTTGSPGAYGYCVLANGIVHGFYEIYEVARSFASHKTGGYVISAQDAHKYKINNNCHA